MCKYSSAAFDEVSDVDKLQLTSLWQTQVKIRQLINLYVILFYLFFKHSQQGCPDLQHYDCTTMKHNIFPGRKMFFETLDGIPANTGLSP